MHTSSARRRLLEEAVEAQHVASGWHTHVHVYMYYIHIYTHIHKYIYRARERERERGIYRYAEAQHVASGCTYLITMERRCCLTAVLTGEN